MPVTQKLNRTKNRNATNSSSSTSKTRKRANLVLEQQARKHREIYNNMVQEHEFPCEVAFNVILLLMRRRDAYLFERYNKSSLPTLKKMIEYIESMKTQGGKSRFQFLFLEGRFGENKKQKITKDEYLADHPKYDIILYRTGDRKTQQVLEKDTYSVEFGRLLKLVCAADLREFYADKMYQRGQPHGGQILYYIDCDGQKSDFMIQMCPAVTSPETQKLLTDDISQYQAIGRGLGITIGWYTPKMGKITHWFYNLGIKFWRMFSKKK